MTNSKIGRHNKRIAKYRPIGLKHMHSQKNLDENISNFLEFLKLREALTLRSV